MTNTRLTKGLLTSVLTLALGAPVLVRAQAAPDLAGTWTFDADRSDQPPARGGGPGRDGGLGRGGGRDGAPGRGGGRGGGVGRGGGRDGLGGGRGRGRGLGAPATQLVITQTASELRIVSVTDQDKETAVYRLDGSETTISGQAGDIKAKAMLDAGTIAISTSQSFDGPAGEVTIEGKDVYSVDGNTLTIERTINTPFGANRRKLVYTMR